MRALAARIGLPSASKPASACLASRIPYGTRITEGRLRAIEKAEESLAGMGFGQVRVRHHGDTARIELEPAEIPRAVALRSRIVAALLNCGFRYTTLDREGYRSGSMDGAAAGSHRRPKTRGDVRSRRSSDHAPPR